MRQSNVAYRKFTDEEIRRANSVDIVSLARSYGYEPEQAGRKAIHMKHSGGLYLFPDSLSLIHIFPASTTAAALCFPA